MKTLTFLFLPVVTLFAFFIFSCGGSDDFVHEETGDMYPESMLSNANCQAPNTKLDVNVNRKFCGNDECLISFAGYRWWTNYMYRGDPYWFYNNGQAWSPRNAYVDGEGLHLMVKKDDLGGGSTWCASEVVLLYEGTGNKIANIDYGSYLVSAKVKSSSSWATLDRNVAFGVFTYEPEKTGNSYNPNRELDLAEITKWGVPPASNVIDPRLATGNAQFTLQDWEQDKNNIHRYSIGEGVTEITLVMKWTAPNKPVTFYQYNGKYTLDNLPSSATYSWTTDASQNKFIMADGCQRFHMNLWMGNFKETDNKGTHPGPSNNQPQEIVVTNFQYRR